MSGEIFIETHDVDYFGLSVAEHLYLVFRDSNGDEYVLRSGAENSLWPFGEMVIEVNVPMAASADDRDGASPRDRSSTPLDFPGLTDDEAWAYMVKYARMIEGADYGYELLGENSNAFVGALLYAAGGTPGDMLPAGVDRNDFIGFQNWDNIVDDVPPPQNNIFYGTNGADRIAGLQIDEAIRARGGHDVVDAGRGNDTVWAGRGSDKVLGGAGDDRLIGGAGNDILKGQNANDRLEGGAGRDVLKGGRGDDIVDGGAGNDILRGGSGADLFVFTKTQAGQTDRVKDFDVARDTLQIAGGVGLDELTLQDRTENGDTYVELTWQGFHIRLDDVLAAELTDDMFSFV